MAITENDYENLQKQQKGLLDIDTQGFYFDNIRPFMKDMLLTCKTDKELLRTIEKVINASDSFCNDKNYEALNESFDILDTAITDANYFNGVMKKAPEEEKNKVRKLIDKIADLRMIIKCEQPVVPEEPKIRNRLNYKEPTNLSPNGENEDFSTHNMHVLNTPILKNRIPNR